MGNSLTRIVDLWLKYRTPEVVVLGNGLTRDLGIKFATTNSLPIVSINDLPASVRVLFCVATRQVFLDAIGDAINEDTPIVIPETLVPSKYTIPLRVSDFDYIEGLIPDNREEVEFRFDFVLLTILGILDRLQEGKEIENHRLAVHLYGFDFDSNSMSKTVGVEFLESLLIRQKSLFELVMRDSHYFSNLNLIDHSNRENLISPINLKLSNSVPAMTREQIENAVNHNNKMMIDRLNRAKAGEVQVVAELTNNHLGDTNRLIQMVKLCKEQGASIIKIQKRDVDVLYTREERSSRYESPFGTTLEAYRKGVELSEDQISYLTVICSQLEIPWFTSVLDMPSFELIKKYRPLCIKAPSTISNHRNFLQHLSESNVEWFFISTGGTSSDFLDWINGVFSHKNIVLMQCTSSYPTAPEDCNVKVINGIGKLRNDKSILPGYSSHDVGAIASQLAISLGAVFIEKHVKLGSVDWIHFDGVALDLSNNELGHFVERLNEATKILGAEEKRILISEHHKYRPNQVHN